METYTHKFVQYKPPFHTDMQPATRLDLKVGLRHKGSLEALFYLVPNHR